MPRWSGLFKRWKWPQKSYQTMDPAKITTAINDSGIVGLGGAAFPTHVKIMPSDKKPIHTLVVNGCECEQQPALPFQKRPRSWDGWRIISWRSENSRKKR
jgi:hypothetical protein